MESKQAIAKLKYARIGQRKILGTCSLVRGKDVVVAKAILIRTQKKAAKFISKTLDSAIANAKNKNMDAKYLFIKSIRADMGPSAKRHIPWSRGTALPIKKRTVHLTIILEEKPHDKKKDKKVEDKTVTSEKTVENKEVKTEVKKATPAKKEKVIKTGKAKVKVKTAK